MKPIKNPFILLLRRLGVLGRRPRPHPHRTDDPGTCAREVLGQPPRPLRDNDDDTPTVPTPHW
ncbi:hypothetical protein ACGFS9_14940 [Streptomyces sp. NPDC048566]|uniref:hypothetical protein n=1 Tax=Streptomyces sp. NPDC048566 TaxID=3365569 RepID=UPI00371AE294